MPLKTILKHYSMLLKIFLCSIVLILNPKKSIKELSIIIQSDKTRIKREKWANA